MELFLGETNHDDVFGDYAQITYIQPSDSKEVTKSMISLKNIPLEGVTIEQQYDKECEEEWEFLEAMEQGADEEVIEEFCDTVQAKLGVMYIARGITAEQVMKEYPKHLEKIKLRPRKK